MRGSGARRPLSLRSILVPAQVALALVLLVGAGLLGRSLARLYGFDAGFRPEGVLTMRIEPPGMGDEDRRHGMAFRRQLLERLTALPGVSSASFGASAPLSGRRMIALVRQVDDRRFQGATGGFPSEQPGAEGTEIGVHDVGPGFFATLGVPLRRGREFTLADREGSPLVAIVNAAAARRFWPGQDPIGHRIAATSYVFSGGLTAEVVGVAGDVLYGRPGDPLRLDLYFPSLQGGLPRTTLFARASGDPAALAAAVRGEVHALDPSLPVFDVSTMDERCARAFSRERFGATLLSLLAGIALMLASVGLYGLMAETVGRRTGEFGVRLALGARPGDILRSVLTRGLGLAGAGLLAGLAAALGLSRLLTSLLFEVRPADAATYAGVSLLLMAVAALACWIPARRAMRIDPARALRTE